MDEYIFDVSDQNNHFNDIILYPNHTFDCCELIFPMTRIHCDLIIQLIVNNLILQPNENNMHCNFEKNYDLTKIKQQ